MPLLVPTNLDITAIKGQSNGAGQAELPPSGELYPTAYNDRLWVLTRGKQWFPAFDPMASIDPKYGGSAYPVLEAAPIGSGLGIHYAQKFADITDNVNIAIVNVAVGGAGLIPNQPSFSINSIYGAGKALIDFAKLNGKITTLIYVGFEREAQTLEALNSAVDNFTSIVNQFRNENGEEILVFFPQLGVNPQNASYPYWEEAKLKQSSISIPNVYMIVADDCEKQSDGIHYTENGNKKLGERIAIKRREILATLPRESF